jgi:hypothetical protein
MTDDIMAIVRARAVDGELACEDAHQIAAEMDMSPQHLAEIINDAGDIRFSRCQLGLFGYGSKAEGKSKIVQAAQNVPDDIREAIEAHAHNGKISCLAVWELAERYKYPRLSMANIVEAMGLQVSPCQLGCF